MIPVTRPSTNSEEIKAIEEVFESGWLGLGSKTQDFEERIKEKLGCKFVIAVNTGTSALHLALDSFGIGKGDEVIVPSITFAASIQAIIMTGARPVFCESRSDNLLIDVDHAKSLINEKTKAIMPVHYAGQVCDMDSLIEIADTNSIFVIEDAAHAFGSSYKGRNVGSFGHATCFSFDPIKNITCGEGGAIVVQDESQAEQIKQKRILGIDSETWHRYQNKRNWFYDVTSHGFRYHMPNFCAAVGLVQLTKLDTFISKKRNICNSYDLAFQNLKAISILNIDYSEAAPFMYVVKVNDNMRDHFMSFLKEQGVSTGVHYIPNHLHTYFEEYAQENLPESTELGKMIVTLPLYPDMTESDLSIVINSVQEFDKKFGKV